MVLYSVVMETYTGRILIRKVDILVEVLGGVNSVSKSELSRICKEIVEQVKVCMRGRAGSSPLPLPLPRFLLTSTAA